MPHQVLIPYRELKSRGVPYSKPHLWRLERVGKFPKRVPIGPSRYGYVESEIDAYINELIEARDKPKTALGATAIARTNGKAVHGGGA